RGFQPRTLGPFESKKNTRGEIFSTTPVGGTSQIILNNEVIFPIVQGIGLKGVVFIDAGNAYGGDQNNIIDDAPYSAGGGVRSLSPLGPLPGELGIPFNSHPRARQPLVA